MDLTVILHHSHRLSNLRHHGAFDSLAEDVAAEVIDAVDGTRCVQGIGRTAAAAVQLGPAIFAFRLRITIALFELALQLRSRDPVPEVPHAVGFIPDELVARE